MSMTLEPCKECGSTDVSWSCAPVNNGQAVDGRVCMREVGMRFYRGCGFCGETLEVIDADDFLGKLNAHLARQSEGVSEEDAERVLYSFDGSFNNGGIDYRMRLGRMRAALTAVWHNRPAQDAAPIPMILHCPSCRLQHIDEPDERTEGWNNPPHRSHLCHGCGTIWRPADVPTVGVVSIKTRGKADTIRPAQEPSEGHSVRVLSHDGDWEGEARWEYQESAYVTQEAVRPAKEKATNYVSGHADSTGKFHATAQEKAEPVARVRISESGSLGISALPGMSRKLSHGQDLYTAPPAERVRVPDVVAIMEHLPDNRAATRAELIRAMALSAAPEATPSPTIDVAAVREVIGELRGTGAMLQSELMDSADKLARAIGDAK